MKKLFLTLLLFCGAFLAFADANWTDNFRLATELAQKENKPILMLFTASDWCGFCIKMEQNAFGVPSFGDFLNKNFVLFKADFPSRKQIPEDIRKMPFPDIRPSSSSPPTAKNLPEPDSSAGTSMTISSIIRTF